MGIQIIFHILAHSILKINLNYYLITLFYIIKNNNPILKKYIKIAFLYF